MQAYHHLGNVTEKRTRSSEATIGDMEEFLNSTPTPRGRKSSFPTIRGLLNHERARHQALRSKAQDQLKQSKARSTLCTPDALQEDYQAIWGLLQRVARKIGTKSVKQVAGFKYRFLKNPLWLRYGCGPTTEGSPGQATCSVTSSSCSSPNMSASQTLSPTTTSKIDSSDCEINYTINIIHPRPQTALLTTADA